MLGGENPEAGFFDVGLRNFSKSEQRHLPNTVIVETILRDSAGQSLRMLDFAPPAVLACQKPVAGRGQMLVDAAQLRKRSRILSVMEQAVQTHSRKRHRTTGPLPALLETESALAG